MFIERTGTVAKICIVTLQKMAQLAMEFLFVCKWIYIVFIDEDTKNSIRYRQELTVQVGVKVLNTTENFLCSTEKTGT